MSLVEGNNLYHSVNMFGSSACGWTPLERKAADFSLEQEPQLNSEEQLLTKYLVIHSSALP